MRRASSAWDVLRTSRPSRLRCRSAEVSDKAKVARARSGCRRAQIRSRCWGSLSHSGHEAIQSVVWHFRHVARPVPAMRGPEKRLKLAQIYLTMSPLASVPGSIVWRLGGRVNHSAKKYASPTSAAAYAQSAPKLSDNPVQHQNQQTNHIRCSGS